MLRALSIALAALVVVSPLTLSFGATGSGPAVSSSPLAFALHEAPDVFSNARNAGETSIGVDPETNAVLFQMRLDTARVTFAADGTPTWTEVSSTATSITTLDPILWTDPLTGRTFVAQLAGPMGLLAFTDDAGATWTTGVPPFSGPSWDHETVGGGPYPPDSGIQHLYPNAIYYCAQIGTSFSQCARSDDGGLTWGLPLPMNTGQCGVGLHGHVVVAPSGTAFVPHGRCGSGQGVMVSRNAGLTWSYAQVPGFVAAEGDPVVAVDAGGRVYFIASSEGRPLVAWSDNEGDTWSEPVDVGVAFGIRNARFPMAVAGDAGRAAVAFFGTTTPGDDQAGCGCEVTGVREPFQGYWHVYVSQTLTGGGSWTTVDVTPNDPVQHGCIWLGGGGNRCRNLLDFQGMTVDAQGRILVGFADGCTPRECLEMYPAAYGEAGDDRGDSLGVIARQVGGPRLYAAFDPPGGVDPLVADAGGPYSGPTGTSIALTGSATGGVAPYAFAWDLDNDGAYDDATGATASFPAITEGTFTVGLRAFDAVGTLAAASALVRVTEGSLPPPEPVASWHFDVAADCTDAQGWTSQTQVLGNDPGAPVGYHVRGPSFWTASPGERCFWGVGEDAWWGYYPHGLRTEFTSPGGAGCISLAPGTLVAELTFRIEGSVPATSPLVVLAQSCDGTQAVQLASFAGTLAPQTVTVDATDALPLGPFRLSFRHELSNAIGWWGGYRLDSFELSAA